MTASTSSILIPNADTIREVNAVTLALCSSSPLDTGRATPGPGLAELDPEIEDRKT